MPWSHGLKPTDIEFAWSGPEQCRNCGIRHLVLFADLTLDDFKLVHEPIDEIEFAPGQMLYKAGAPATHMLTIRGGLVKLVQYLEDGSQRIVRLLRRGDLAGLEATADHDPVYQHDAIGREDSSRSNLGITAARKNIYIFRNPLPNHFCSASVPLKKKTPDQESEVRNH